MEGSSMLLRGENGSGKTLAYLLPILNQLYEDKNDTNDSVTFKIGKQNEDYMFQNATQVLYD